MTKNFKNTKKQSRNTTSLTNPRRISSIYHIPSRPPSNYEMKIFSVYNTGTSSTSGGVVSITSILQGADLPNRIGRHVRIRYIDLLFNFFLAANGTTEQAAVHIFVDRLAGGGTPGYSTVFDTSSAPAGQALYNNSAYASRFIPLWDRDATMEIAGRQQKTWRVRIPIPKGLAELEYFSSATNPANINNIFIATGTSIGSVATTFTYSVQILFDDL
jgi:hypothetical protein